MRRFRQIIFSLILAQTSVPVLAAGAAPIIGGIEVCPGAREWPAVRLLNVAGGHCSGVFIDDSHLLTAAHCVRWDDGTDLTPAEVRLEPDGEMPESVIVHELYGSDPSQDPDYNHDIAVLRFPSRKGRQSARLATARPRPGDKIIMVGFGRSDEDKPVSGGVLRKGTNVMSGMDGTHIEVITTAGGPSFHSAILGSGDSGGPWFNADVEVVGISSLGTMRSSSAVSIQSPRIRKFIALATSSSSRKH